jgi:DNA-binding MarR family transcriptional regulator
MQSGTNLFLRLCSEWRSKLPPTLAQADPGVLIRLLELGSQGSGVLQSAARRELGVNQPLLSKLMKKLLQVKWITVEQSATDSRSMPMKTTRVARDWLSNLEKQFTRLRAAQESEPTRTRTKVPLSKPKQPHIWDALSDEGGSAEE